MQEQRINLKPGLIASGIIIALMLILSAWAWVRIPAGQLVPTRWGLSGQPDAYGSKAIPLLAMPLTAPFLAGLFALIALIEPRKMNLRKSMKAYTAIWISTLIVLLAVHIFGVLGALGRKMDANTVMPVLIGLLFVVMGNYMGKIRSNYFIGVRGPWALSSDLSWNKSNRLGGKLAILLGVIAALGAFMDDMCLWLVLLIAETIVITAILMVYSYLVWRADPARGGSASEPKWMVPASILLVIALAVGMVHASQKRPSPVDIVARAQEVVQSMANGDFAGAEKYFDARMKQALPPGKLQSVWQSLVEQNGPFKKVRGTRTECCWPFRSVYVTCRFRDCKLDLKVVFSPSGQVSGLWVVPTPCDGNS